MARKTQPKSGATLTIRRAADMTPEGRHRIAVWIRKQAAFLLHNSKELGPLFAARYLYS